MWNYLLKIKLLGNSERNIYISELLLNLLNMADVHFFHTFEPRRTVANNAGLETHLSHLQLRLNNCVH